jgi:hypothetical protein
MLRVIRPLAEAFGCTLYYVIAVIMLAIVAENYLPLVFVALHFWGRCLGTTLHRPRVD